MVIKNISQNCIHKIRQISPSTVGLVVWLIKFGRINIYILKCAVCGGEFVGAGCEFVFGHQPGYTVANDIHQPRTVLFWQRDSYVYYHINSFDILYIYPSIEDIAFKGVFIVCNYGLYILYKVHNYIQ